MQDMFCMQTEIVLSIDQIIIFMEKYLWNECPTSINHVNEVVNLLPTAKKLKKATLKNFNLLMWQSEKWRFVFNKYNQKSVLLDIFHFLWRPCYLTRLQDVSVAQCRSRWQQLIRLSIGIFGIGCWAILLVGIGSLLGIVYDGCWRNAHKQQNDNRRALRFFTLPNWWKWKLVVLEYQPAQALS